MEKHRNGQSGGATVLDVRRQNETSVLRHLYFAAPLTRQDLIEATGLSPGTITNVIGRLIDKGLVIEAGTEESAGGRPRVLLELARDRGAVVGVEIGETQIRIEVFDLALAKVAERVHPGGDREPAHVIALIARSIKELVSALPGGLDSVLGVGVGAPGVVDKDPSGRVHAVAFGWTAVPVGDLLTEQLGLPVVVENSAKTLGQAEMWYGAARGASHAVIALLGTGVGAGIFTDGRLFMGSHSSAGEWGHTPIHAGGRLCRCGARGCLEAYIGGFAISQRWSELTSQPAMTEETAVAAIAHAGPDDQAAREMLDLITDDLAAGLATLINLFNPERIVIQGWVGLLLGRQILERLRLRTRAYALQEPFDQMSIVLGEVGPDAGALGPATFVVDAILRGDYPGVRDPQATLVPHAS